MPTLIVQDDAGTKVDANTYIDIAFSDVYHDDRGNNTAWTLQDQEVKEIALINAWQYLDNRFEFAGIEKNNSQNTRWPRRGCDNRGRFLDVIPVLLKNAQAEYALRAVTAELTPDPVTDETGGKVIEKSESVGIISETVKYSSGVPIKNFKPYPAADMLLRDYITLTNRLMRA